LSWYSATQGIDQFSANAPARLDVAGSVKSTTVRCTGTDALNPVAVTVTAPSYPPGAAPCGTSTSIQATTLCPGATLPGNACRA
jgi:hypothetical protein